jgi:hypothetical protein
MEGTNGFGVEKSSGKAYWVVLVPGKDDGVNKVLGWLVCITLHLGYIIFSDS